ncbi:MAG: ferredoxin [Desulfovibrio sp.]
MPTVSIDLEECIGCGTCAELCPEVFEMNDDEEKAYVIKEEGGPECVDEAVDTCPVECIIYE